jgi:hypothetical protein
VNEKNNGVRIVANLIGSQLLKEIENLSRRLHMAKSEWGRELCTF